MTADLHNSAAASTAICPECGVKSVAYPMKKFGETVTYRRDYMPTTFVIHLRPGTATTYIVTPEIERLAVHIRSLDAGKLSYAFDTPLRGDGLVQDLLDADERIEKWYTVCPHGPNEGDHRTAMICDSHIHFVYPQGAR